MTETFSDFDPAEYLTSPAAIAEFMSDALETGDAGYIAKALGVVARAKGMTELARETGLSREQQHEHRGDREDVASRTEPVDPPE